MSDETLFTSEVTPDAAPEVKETPRVVVRGQNRGGLNPDAVVDDAGARSSVPAVPRQSEGLDLDAVIDDALSGVSDMAAPLGAASLEPAPLQPVVAPPPMSASTLAEMAAGRLALERHIDDQVSIEEAVGREALRSAAADAATRSSE